MMTFAMIWIGGIAVTLAALMLACKGEKIKYKDLLPMTLMLIFWPIGLTCLIVAVVQDWAENSDKMEQTVFTFPGGKK